LSENKKTPNKKVEKIISQPQSVDKVSDYSILCLFIVKRRKEADILPQEHLLRAIDKYVDFNFIYE
jgi:hypothetical protein